MQHYNLVTLCTLSNLCIIRKAQEHQHEVRELVRPWRALKLPDWADNRPTSSRQCLEMSENGIQISSYDILCPKGVLAVSFGCFP